MARIQYEADGPVPPERFIAALTDFSDRRPDLWPGLDASGELRVALERLGRTLP